ncbi:MAG: diguanylate cyclase [Clostridia bacterium]|nr:diguanylate cyclase [Clostridia bacterium]
MGKSKKISFTLQYVIIFGVVLLLTNIVLGLVLMHQSVNTLQRLVRHNMLNISKTAAGIVDGDVLENLTEKDVGGPAFNGILSDLRIFQDNVDIEYIYAVRQTGEDEFVFTVDADPGDPADFGENVLVTYALREAAKGTATVDSEPAQDEWGNFYSSYSPVYDSEGKIAGIIGVDFSTEWYDRQIREHMVSFVVILIMSVLIGGFVVVYFTGKLRKRIRDLNSELSMLSKDVDELTEEITSNAIYREGMEASDLTTGGDLQNKDAVYEDEIETLNRKLQSMHSEMKHYLDYMHVKAYQDALTGVGNTAAYQEKQQKIDGQIGAGPEAGFVTVAVFDINDLKKINDRYGHVAGDRIIQGAASAVADVFGIPQTFRIGGDEFAAVVPDISEEDMAACLGQVEERVSLFNEKRKGEGGVLSISMGTASYDPGLDASFRELFVRADETMYVNKNKYHSSLAENPREN